MKKKLMSALLALVMVLSLLPVNAFAAGEQTDIIADNGVGYAYRRPAITPQDSDSEDSRWTEFEAMRNVFTVKFITPVQAGDRSNYEFAVKAGGITTPDDQSYKKLNNVFYFGRTTTEPGSWGAYFEAPDGVMTDGQSTYTVKVTDKDGNYEEQSVELVKVTLKDNGGNNLHPEDFAENEKPLESNSEYFIYAQKSKYDYQNTYLPLLKDKEEGVNQFVGWSDTKEQQSGIVYTQKIQAAGKTVYAVFGIKPVREFIIAGEEPSGSIPESKLEFKTTIDYGAEVTDDKAIKIYIVNTGNQMLGNETNSGFYFTAGTIKNFELTFDTSESGGNAGSCSENNNKYWLKAGENAGQVPNPNKVTFLVLKCKPKSNLPAGTYTDTLKLDNPQSIIRQISLKVTVNKPKVTVTMPDITKHYGQAVTVNEQGQLQYGSETADAPTIKLNDETEGAPKYEELDLKLHSDGFNVKANVNTGDGYGYKIVSSNGNYDITVQGTIKVERTEPEGEAGVKASAVKVGEPLNGSVLTGDFLNPYSREPVAGTLAWTNESMGNAPDAAQTIKGKEWTFTPLDAENYETVNGTADIEVVAKEPVTITQNLNDHPNEVTYNGNPHQLAFIVTDAKSQSVPGAALTFQYKAHEGITSDHDDVAQTGSWTDIKSDKDWPKDAGTWDIKVTYAGNTTYAPAEAIFHLIIEPKTVSLVVTTSNITKTYDGTRQINIGTINAVGAEFIKDESLKVDKYTAEFEDPNAGTGKTVTISGITLAGNNDKTNPKNYKVPDEGVKHITGAITPKPITLKVAGDGTLSKHYGETFAFEAGSFTSDGFVGDDGMADLNVVFSSAGADSAAVVDNYKITAALASDGNYKLDGSTVSGTLKVEKAGLELQGDVTATTGKNGAKKGSVTISGTVVNKYNDQMQVEGKWTVDGGENGRFDENLPEENIACTFTPTDTTNYDGTLSETVTVTLTKKTPIQITFNEELLTTKYNGQVQETVNIGNVKTQPAAEVEVDYEQSPINAGTYKVTITAMPKPGYAEEYAVTTESHTLTITKADVTVKSSSGFAAKEGKPLPEVKIPNEYITGVDGEKLPGTFTWDNPTATVTQESQSFAWHFEPEDAANYNSPVTGEFTVTMAADTRKVSAAVYNLPEGDYAVVTVGSDADKLNPGEKVVFYKDAECTDPVSSETAVPESVEKFTVPLDSDALDKEKGTIYAKIFGKKTATAEITHLSELGFNLPFDMVLLHVGGTNAGTSETVTVTPTDDSYMMKADAWTVSGDGANLVEVVDDKETVGSATFHALAAGTTPITISITFEHPDPAKKGETIIVTKELPLNITKHYVVFIEEVENGSATAKPTETDAGKTVTVTLKAVSGYHASGLKVYKTGADGNKDTAQPVKTSGSGSSYTFTMPESDVVLVPAFEKNASTGGGSTGGGGFGGGGFGGGTAVPSIPSEPEAPTLKPEASADASGEAKAPVTSTEVESAVEEAKQNGAGEIVIEPQVTGSANKVSVELEKESVGAIAKGSADLTVKTDAASVTLPDDSLAALAAGTGSSVTVSVEAKTGGAVDIEVAVDGETVGSLSGGMKLELPKASGGNVLVIVGPDGSETIVKKSVVSGGSAYALLDGSCTVKVVDNIITFADVTSADWYSDAVDFAGSHELFKGVGENTFAPNAAMTRGMFATVLWRFESGEAVDTKSAFADVADGSWYTDGVAWASEHKIINGYNSTKFAPEDNVTREQLATMLYRYAEDIGLDVSAGGSLSKFSDAGSVSSYAKEPLEWAVGAGLIKGNTDDTINPKGGAKRAEVATIFMRFCEMITK